QAITGGYNVHASAWGYASSTTIAVPLATGANTRSFSLTALANVTISGTVQGNPGGLLSGAHVRIQSSSADDSMGEEYYAQTDATGQYSVSVPTGTVNWITVDADGYLSQYTNTSVAGANVTVDFTLLPAPPPPTKMRGHILDCAGSNLFIGGKAY